MSPTGPSWWMRQGKQLAPWLKWRRDRRDIERLKSSYCPGHEFVAKLWQRLAHVFFLVAQEYTSRHECMKSLLDLAWTTVTTKELRTATTHGPTSRLAFARWTSSEQASDTNPRLGFCKGERCWLNAQSQWQVATSVQTSALFSLKLMQLEVQDCWSGVLSCLTGMTIEYNLHVYCIYIYTYTWLMYVADSCSIDLLEPITSASVEENPASMFSHHGCTTLGRQL